MVKVSRRPFLLFHWSPIGRRKRIEKEGLCPGNLSKDKDWRPPYICFSRSPSIAWGLSAMTTDEPGYWDLWMVWSTEVPKGWETLSTDGSGKPTEYRVYDRIKKSKVWYVGTRLRKLRARCT